MCPPTVEFMAAGSHALVLSAPEPTGSASADSPALHGHIEFFGRPAHDRYAFLTRFSGEGTAAWIIVRHRPFLPPG